MATEKQFHVGVKAMVVNHNGQVLLMKEDASTHSTPTDDYWDFPGGRMQEGETVLEALAREVEEETGISEIGNPQFDTAVISNHEIKLSDTLTVGLVLMVYKVQISPTAEIKLSHEHLDYEWVDLVVAKKRLQHKYPKEFTDAL